VSDRPIDEHTLDEAMDWALWLETRPPAYPEMGPNERRVVALAREVRRLRAAPRRGYEPPGQW
jgi:hypothetical protein